MTHALGIDVGGTFTDFVAYDREKQKIEVWKELSTPTDPVVGIVGGLGRYRESDGAVEHMRLGTTVATNAILERKGATVAYVTTKGFKDVIFIQRGNRKYHYDMSWVKPKPLAKRRHCFELDERIDAYGAVLKPLDEAEVRALAATIKATPEIGAVAVCTLFSYLNPAHELRIKEILSEALPDMPISISYDVLPKWKEYERASTTLADAYLKPIVSKQMGSMRQRLNEAGLTAPTVVIKSNGGEMTLDAAAAAPVNLVVSGPTGGVIASRHVARLTGIEHLVTLDMGGTSTDVSVILDGQERFTTAFEIEWGVPIQIPIIDIRTIGAGGGSIAWIDKGGMLRVGPQSAGANPGPACYGKGDIPTVTDANVLLGRIDPNNFLGGRMKLDAERARAAVAGVAEALGQDIEQTAISIVRIANSNMVGALRSVLIEGGLDPRDFTLCTFGGAGPLHVGELMIDMGIPRGIVPNHPGQFSAFGFIMTQARVDRQRTAQLTSNRFDKAKAASIMASLVDEAKQQLTDQGFTGDLSISRSLEMRYLGQNYELELSVDESDLAPEADIEQLWQKFHDTHKARFGFSTKGEIIEIVNFVVTAVSAAAVPEMPKLDKAMGPPVPTSRRSVGYVQGRFDVPVYDRAMLRAGHVVDGPLIVEEPASVSVVCPGQRLTVDDYGHLLIDTIQG
ncbi:MAG TPA: hydantoinase/oxoprolinase family protein [Geminicoccus sp.]|jgi:N-methylhydantoinase A|uniref:hydantoinase/oxoprolinase family protein n=1 Tax=Geminicoccus sp. TaxID=2024832 RepID=UPI002E2F0294|nr:hydantoinase/oxoprolinase family protein [Geminicoccus sp.]HEX2528231.1 hydantoinase/oxoprolinase family protein [Geminicoccus sp.]